MDIYEREHVSAVVNYFWGKGTATPQNINERFVIQVAKIGKRILSGNTLIYGMKLWLSCNSIFVFIHKLNNLLLINELIVSIE